MDDDLIEHTVLRRSWPVARKRHTCRFCKQSINPGERYQLEVAIHEGEFVSDHICKNCQ